MLNFTLKQLRYVEAADRSGSIAKAAEELNISQSSITAAIDALESGLGFDLFVRTPARGIRATASGRDALGLIRRFIHQSHQFEEELSSLGGLTRGTVRIACYATAAPSFLPPVLRAITEGFPDLSIQLLEGNMARIMEFLDEGEADVAFTYSQVLSDRCHFEPLFEAPPYAMVSVDDPLAGQSSTTFAELATRPMVMLDLPHTRDYFVGMFEALGLSPNIAHSTRSSEIVRALVAGGFGFSLLNIRPVDYRESESRYRIVPISDAPLSPVFGIATMDGAQQTRMVRAFVQSCTELRDRGVFEDLVVRCPRQPTPPFPRKM
ncbi:LysR family transcriptional regulator [Ruegeria pomeroyi]|nr:LysR family transcriptional regulator [Ruegeria pomeroyi]MCE8528449.1 LysR family transcriptional regulator [Ruegeria pomeroyi]MCE8533135.1 LysR family transcriptional regulator [Ruegeria pomeroyi]MCE8545097.1 LysR family transcriptional regulator [Ruegeria pomeroyi]